MFETQVFQKVVEQERVPVLEVFKRQRMQVLLTALLQRPEQVPGYIVGAFIFTYGTTELPMTRDFPLTGVIAQTVLGFLWVMVAGRLSDHVRHKTMYMLGCVFMGFSVSSTSPYSIPSPRPRFSSPLRCRWFQR